MGRLDGRVAFITGAAQGVGEGIALAFASEGADIGIADLNLEGAERTAEECRRRGSRAVAVLADVSERASVEPAVAQVAADLGGIHILVNNAHDFRLGVTLEQTTDDLMERSWRTATMGTLYCMQAALPHLRVRGGRIINIGSGSGLDGDVGSASYVAAKEGVRALTRVAAREWGPLGVCVNTLCPFSSSPRWEAFAAEHPGRAEKTARSLPLRRGPGHPEHDIGRAALFLASDDSSYVTGQTLFVEGGRIRI